MGRHSPRRRLGGAVALTLLAAQFLVRGVESWAMSPLNLSPDWPARLDDAYPVPVDEWVAQLALAQTWSSSGTGASRLTGPVMLRTGVTSGLELDLGFTTLQAGQLDGATLDHRAVRLGGLARLAHQDGTRPSLAVRLTSQIPIAGPADWPSLTSTLLASWALPNTPAWVHVNAHYLVVPEAQPGMLTPDRRGWWDLRIGAIRALRSDGAGLLASIGAMPNPWRAGTRLALDPEIGGILPLTDSLIAGLTGGITLSTPNAARVQVGLSWTF